MTGTDAVAGGARGARLHRTDVIAAAMRLLDERGLDGLTMRGLAERLGVRVGALYWHVKDRRAVLTALAERPAGHDQLSVREDAPAISSTRTLSGPRSVARRNAAALSASRVASFLRSRGPAATP